MFWSERGHSLDTRSRWVYHNQQTKTHMPFISLWSLHYYLSDQQYPFIFSRYMFVHVYNHYYVQLFLLVYTCTKLYIFWCIYIQYIFVAGLYFLSFLVNWTIIVVLLPLMKTGGGGGGLCDGEDGGLCCTLLYYHVYVAFFIKRY